MAESASISINANLPGLENIEERVKDFRPPLKEFGEYMKLTTREERFDKQQSPDGQAWKKLKPKYKAWKISKGKQSKILRFDDNLRDSMAYQLKGKTKLLFGSVLEYAATHQFGRGKIPQREMVGMNDADIKELEEIVTDYLIR